MAYEFLSYEKRGRISYITIIPNIISSVYCIKFCCTLTFSFSISISPGMPSRRAVFNPILPLRESSSVIIAFIVSPC